MEALIDAAAEGRLDAYLAQGNLINVVANHGVSALHALARNKSGTKRDRIALDALLAAGIDVDLANNRNETALFRAVLTSSNWMIAPLLSSGASLDIINNKGLSIDDIADKDNRELIACLSARQLDSMTPVPTYTRARRSI